MNILVGNGYEMVAELSHLRVWNGFGAGFWRDISGFLFPHIPYVVYISRGPADGTCQMQIVCGQR